MYNKTRTDRILFWTSYGRQFIKSHFSMQKKKMSFSISLTCFSALSMVGYPLNDQFPLIFSIKNKNPKPQIKFKIVYSCRSKITFKFLRLL